MTTKTEKKGGSEKYEFVFDNEDEVIKKIATAIEKYKPELHNLYKWSVPSSITEFKPKGENPFKKTISLREWIKEQDLENNADLCKWIVKDWGRIKTGKNLKASVEKAFKAQLDEDKKFDFKRISSWSKVLAFQDPKTRAIYDVRVIYSLNWLLLKAGSKKFLPMPDGRNSLLNFFSYENLLYFKVYTFKKVMDEFKKDLEGRREKYKKSSLVSSLGKEVFISEGCAYQTYCDLLGKLSKKIYPNDDFGVTKIEMILFSIADTEILEEVLKKLKL